MLARPANFALQEAAAIAHKRHIGERDNFKGERAYLAFYEELRANREEWLAFLSENPWLCQNACAILGTLATIKRQRGDLAESEQVLDMEEPVLARYQRHAKGAVHPDDVRTSDALTNKYQRTRYNVFFLTQRYSECVRLFRSLARYERKWAVPYPEQEERPTPFTTPGNFVAGIPQWECPALPRSG